MTLATLLPLISRYHKGDQTGATLFFENNPTMLAWVRAEMTRLRTVPQRGSPPQPDFVTTVHLKAYERMVAEFEGSKKT